MSTTRLRARNAALSLLAVTAALAFGCPASAQVKETPYWASISANEARMRVGPSLDYPSNWVYRRADLPVRVVQVLGNWRKIEDPAGTQGWMHVRLLSATETAIVTGRNAQIHEKRDDGSALLYTVEPGVVGRVSKCSDGWCLFDVRGQRGFIHASSLWGAVSE